MQGPAFFYTKPAGAPTSRPASEPSTRAKPLADPPPPAATRHPDERGRHETKPMTAEFLRLLAETPPALKQRRWLFVAPDQLNDGLGPLATEAPGDLGIVLVESSWKAAQRPYHKQKLALVLANQRHFALEQARRGVGVRYVFTDEPYGAALRAVAEEVGMLLALRPAERELRAELAPLVRDGLVELLEHDGWLTSEDDFRAAAKDGPPWRMDAFYRHVRRRTGLLMDERGKPLGGKFSHDADNRKPWRGEPEAPEPPRFEPDAVTREVGELIETRYAHHPGTLRLDELPATLDDAERSWAWARSTCLESFGPYEDAMSTRSASLFHTRISSLLNLHRLLPRRVLDDVVQMELPLASQEGFVRQLLGWREFVRHVHAHTDGFRELPNVEVPQDSRPGDGGFGRWRGEPWPSEGTPADGGAAPSTLAAEVPLPAAYWGEPSGLACLDHTVAEVLEHGYTHHIPRLMVLANIGTLLGVSPRELTDWFWVAFTDAYDWVVEPNVLAMGTYAAGDVMTTKPYVSGGAYLKRMGDFCGDCAFDPKRDCPLTRMYWAFLDRNAERLAGNHRVRVPLASLEKRDPQKREGDREVHRRVVAALERGEVLRPDALAEA